MDGQKLTPYTPQIFKILPPTDAEILLPSSWQIRLCTPQDVLIPCILKISQQEEQEQQQFRDQYSSVKTLQTNSTTL